MKYIIRSKHNRFCFSLGFDRRPGSPRISLELSSRKSLTMVVIINVFRSRKFYHLAHSVVGILILDFSSSSNGWEVNPVCRSFKLSELFICWAASFAPMKTVLTLNVFFLKKEPPVSVRSQPASVRSRKKVANTRALSFEFYRKLTTFQCF